VSRQQYDDTNRGALFKNDRKEQDSHPDLSGKINVDGKEYWLSGWTKRNEDGSFKVLSLSVKPKEARPERAQQARREAFREEQPQRGRQSATRREFDDQFQDDDIGF
jgi:hypothetical protein